MNLKEEKSTRILLLLVIIGLIVLVAYKLFFEIKKNSTEKIDTKTISLVENPSDFYTVSSCVSKILGFASINDKANLYSLLTSDYKTDKSLSKDDVFNVIGISANTYYNFNPRKIYTQRLSKNLYKFYVYGLLEMDTMDSISSSQDYYIIIILDRENMTFAFEPYNGDMFK